MAGPTPPGIEPYDRPPYPPIPPPFLPPRFAHPTSSFPPPHPLNPAFYAPQQQFPGQYDFPHSPHFGLIPPKPTSVPFNPAIHLRTGIRLPPRRPGIHVPDDQKKVPQPVNARLILPPGTDTGFKLHVRQQPERARMCGFGEKDRRPIDPPPVVELEETNGPISPGQRQRLVVQCTLWNEEGTEHRNIIRTTTGTGPTAGLGSAEELPVQPEEKHVRVMMGNIFANAKHLNDEKEVPGYFYIFPDLSIRVEGRYRLKFDLLRVVLPPPSPDSPGVNQVIAEVLSDVFTVYAAKKFPCMKESTALTRAFARQGVKISVRNEQRGRRDRAGRAKRKRRAVSVSADEEDEEATSVVSSENAKRPRLVER
jgi:Velvet factor